MIVQLSDYIDGVRLNRRLEAMARIGATEAGGVNRQALTVGDAHAQNLLAGWGRQIGMCATRDPAGNLFLRLQGSDADLPCVLSGSHLDTQPTGGRYDGVYGVLAALEVAEAMVAAGVVPKRSIEVVAWMNEEGSRFAPGMMGSAVYGGARGLQDILAVSDESGVTVAQALTALCPVLENIDIRPLSDAPHRYVEAHIEQGPVLEREGLQIGIVTGIQGKHTFTVQVQGEAAHAGTALLAERRDALLSATAIVQALACAIHDDDDLTRFTIGRFNVTPNAPSVVASRVQFSIDLRHPDTAELQRLAALIVPTCEAHAAPCSVSVTCLSAVDSLQFPAPMRDCIRRAAIGLGLKHRDLLSAAGHDARYLHPLCPSAMIFVPCRGGITHNESEYALPDDLTAGARVLADVLGDLCLNEETS